MSLVYRIKRLVKSDLHAFVEGIEEKKWVLAQAIRDMEEELEKLDAEDQKRRAGIAELQSRLGIHEAQETKWEQDIDFAMREKRDEIAKPLIKKLLLTQHALQSLRQELANAERELQTLEQNNRSKREKYEEILARSEPFNLQRVDDDVFSSAAQLVPQENCLEHQVELEFLRRLQKMKEGGHAS